MNVVVNATPLIALALVGQLSLLREMFDAVIVPRAVYEEVVIDGYGQPGSAELAQASWIQVVSPARAVTLEPMLLGLDSGELSVLLLAQEIQPDWVIIDERLARRACRGSGASVLCVFCAICGAILSGSICELRRSRKEQPVSSYGVPLERMRIRYFLASAVVCLGSKI